MNDTVSLEAAWLEIKSHLEAKKKQIQDEIVNYPPPIPACDVQFNYLLEERARITQELSRLQATSGKVQNDGDPAGAIREFIRSCEYLEEGMKAGWA